ncbi:hypothetical protein [Nocardia farcinica]|uniref:hypothetical protein n=1 Tax=Nocardia farcinica TaxID=37329 RepID=UPI002455D111|nr:hypothetical protein [Nocardia farcinica]
MTHDVFTDHYRVLSTDAAARARLLADPRAELLRHFGYLPDGDYRLEVVEQRSDTITILLPAPPAEHEDPAARLAEVTGRIYDILFTTGVGGFLIPAEELTWLLRDLRSHWASRERE